MIAWFVTLILIEIYEVSYAGINSVVSLQILDSLRMEDFHILVN